MYTLVSQTRRWTKPVCGVLLVVAAIVTYSHWVPVARQCVKSIIASRRDNTSLEEHDSSPATSAKDDHSDHDHADHDHGSHEHDAANSLELSVQAQGNLGLTKEFLTPIVLETFQRTLTVPGIIVERPGRTRMEVSTPMAGVVTQVYAVEGEAVNPGDLLFEIQITAEELTETQTELLKTLGDLDIEEKEITRLSKVTETGAVPQKLLLERQYAKEKLENQVRAQREALRLHGLSNAQIDSITKQRHLFRDVKIVAPQPGGANREIQLSEKTIIPANFAPAQQESSPSVPLILTVMPVHVGQTVAAGTTLAELADYSELYIEGRTFERDVNTLSRVVANGWQVTALFEGTGDVVETVPNLDLIYSAAEIHADSRTLPFYVRLPNEITRRADAPDGNMHVEWRYRPGRRLQLLVPIEEMKDQIVLPVQSIARDGVESYVFQQNGKHFDRVPVRIKYRDSYQAVIANDGSLFPGDVVARTGAHLMQIALKNKSGGGVDPHAGHNH